METFSTCYPPSQQPLYTSPPPRNLRRVPNLRNHGGVGRRSDMRSSSLQRITISLNRYHRNPIQFSLNNTNYLDFRSDLNFISTMADSSAKKEIKSGDALNVVKDSKETQKLPEIPPPPEKPLPGDCCGNGCVPCVWDTYYEELEEYNKLLKGESDSTIG